ncbi:MAG TPA: hypothetical protein VFM05_06100, partial [Candidatus Saccharimonadales bacterium]|nr:hypothetical protein [Candidatus Saccharimonadales bacterium]
VNEVGVPPAPWTEFDQVGLAPLGAVIAVDGSLQTVASTDHPVRELAFVKTALVRLDKRELEKIDKRMPHPVHMKALMRDCALHAATVFPLRNIRIKGQSHRMMVRHIVRDSLKLEADGLAYDTLKWLAYRKWDISQHSSPSFGCPHCDEESAGLPFDSDEGECSKCGSNVFISDVIGFHLEMSEDSAPESLASAYMNIHETLLLFSVVRHFWIQGDFHSLDNLLLIKDGPLTLRGQYSKLVPAVRALLAEAANRKHPIYLVGQEKTGHLVDHLAEFASLSPPLKRGEFPCYAVLSHKYVRNEVYRTPDLVNPYGYRTNYGEKVFVKLDPYSWMVLNVPTGEYLDDNNKPASIHDLIGFERILATLPSLVSYQNEGALIPINLANGVA